MTNISLIGFVAIGRNEGERLKRCLRSLRQESDSVVYVDSGSTDGSVEFAKSIAVEVLALDTSATFTMSRARNAGWKLLVEKWPTLEFIQLVDGDCELIEGWVPAATAFLAANPQVAAVCGRRRERFPEKSIFNRLCETEWNTPVGEAKACGGDSLMRRSALEEVAGYNEDLIAGGVRRRAGGLRPLAEDGVLTILAKLPRYLGIQKYRKDHQWSRAAKIIEYKS